MSNSLRTSLEAASIIFKGTYPYLLHPLFDGFPSIQPALLNEVVCEMEKLIKPFLPIDKMITVEAMGIPIATVLSQKMDISLTIIRKRRYGLSDEICVKQQTGYASSSLYVNGINKGETIIFIDDIINYLSLVSALAPVMQATFLRWFPFLFLR